MIRRPPRSTLDRSSAASDVYKRQLLNANRSDFVNCERDRSALRLKIASFGLLRVAMRLACRPPAFKQEGCIGHSPMMSRSQCFRFGKSRLISTVLVAFANCDPSAQSPSQEVTDDFDGCSDLRTGWCGHIKLGCSAVGVDLASSATTRAAASALSLIHISEPTRPY